MAAEVTALELAALGAVSFSVGVLSGTVGMALGIIRLPVMLVAGIDPLVAGGTNLAVSVAGGAAGAWPHFRAGRVVTRIVITMGVPALIGSFIGGRFAHFAQAWLLLTVVALFLFWSSVVMFTQVFGPRSSEDARTAAGGSDAGPAGPQKLRVWCEAGWGVVIGLIGGAVGLVLGTVRMPTLINVLRMDAARAVGTNTVVGILAGLFGFLGHLWNGQVDWLLVAVMGSTAMAGSFLGARFMGRIDPRRLRVLIALVVLAMAPVTMWRAYLDFTA